MNVRTVVAVALGAAALAACQASAQVVKGKVLDLAQPMEFGRSMKTSYGRVLPPGRYFLEVREAPDGMMNLLFLNERHAMIGLTQARFLGLGTIGAGMQTSAAFLKNTDTTGSKVLDKTSPLVVGSTAADKRSSTAELKITDQAGSKVADKTTPPVTVGSNAADKWKFNGEPGSQVEHKNWSPQWGGKTFASAATGLPAGETFAHLGFGVNSRARFENNAIIIVGGSQGSGEIIAALTPAGR